MKKLSDKKFLVLALVISWSAAIIELLGSHRMVVYLSYGLVVPLMMFLPRVVYALNKKVRNRFNIKLVINIEYFVVWVIALNAPASLWLHSMGFQYDRFLHFIVNMIDVPICILMIVGFGVESRKKILYLTASLLIAGLLLFEGYQYSADVVFGTQLFHDAVQDIRTDVTEDIIFGTLGVFTGLYLFARKLDILKKLGPGGEYRVRS